MHSPSVLETIEPNLPSESSEPESLSDNCGSSKLTKLGQKPSLDDLRSYQDSIIKRIKYLRKIYGRKLHHIAEYERPRTHRDHLLGEMEWMAEDFDRERKLKIASAKKLVRASLGIIKQKQEQAQKVSEEELAMKKKLANRVSKMITKYWSAVVKIACHIRSLQEEEKKQNLRNRRLDKLVDKQLELSNKVAKKLHQGNGPVVIQLKWENEQWRAWEDKDEVQNVAEMASLMQPKGITLATSKVFTKLPFLIRGRLREYQHIGLDWLVTLHDKKLNGILADEMGLGKTIQTIALLSYLACERGVWGPHLIVVPTSIVMNWEMELKRWCPALKVLTYFGTQKERKLKRQGWSKPNSFHVCITSYKLVVQDHFAFKRKQWYYLILDEAQHIKNFHSQRWQILLKFNSQRRLLLTGTPLQNDVMELWSLLHFLMPDLFTSHEDFYAWFSSPFHSAISNNTDFSLTVIQRLHSILRPFLLRRMKKDVETQLPDKIHHIIFCPLSRRQQYLYDEFLERRYVQVSGDCVSLMNVLMQLRKVCNHPDLFEPRDVKAPFQSVQLRIKMHPMFLINDEKIYPWVGFADREKNSKINAIEISYLANLRWKLGITMVPELKIGIKIPAAPSAVPYNKKKTDIVPIYGAALHDLLKIEKLKNYRGYSANLNKVYKGNKYKRRAIKGSYIKIINPRWAKILISSLEDRLKSLSETMIRYQVIQPKVSNPSPILDLAKNCQVSDNLIAQEQYLQYKIFPKIAILHYLITRQQLLFPDRQSIEHDCGKLRKLSALLHKLSQENHKCVIFTQMTKMLDILEKFLNLHGYTYVRLDGNTKVETRQRVIDIFNLDPRVFCFISSTRSGGLGINLTGADTVIFYDTDWNPAMDKQAQDRCHRIGQTRNVHIYRLISSYTIEENILKKSLQKSHLDDLIMEEGQFTTQYLQHQRVKVEEFFENVSDEALEEACKQVEDAEDIKALRSAQQEEIQEENEFEDSSKQFEFMSQVDPVTKLCIDNYLIEHPSEDIEEEIEENEESDEESSEEEDQDMAVEWVDGGEQIYKERMEFLTSRYIVY
ncbi:unnamed protein product [Blepharisma stoltei]|uniref:Uncharacterized protein n=1 Tax=Blepharisma stoltei TaxID=1481888 RepID=A0AAU9IVG0_9CILI|nr:unnamed protein product [Blepharisma stoltei]